MRRSSRDSRRPRYLSRCASEPRDRVFIAASFEVVTTMPDGPRYDDDYYAWTQYQAEVLRTMRRADNRLDRERVAEEIEDLGKSERGAEPDRSYRRTFAQACILAGGP